MAFEIVSSAPRGRGQQGPVTLAVNSRSGTEAAGTLVLRVSAEVLAKLGWVIGQPLEMQIGSGTDLGEAIFAQSGNRGPKLDPGSGTTGGGLYRIGIGAVPVEKGYIQPQTLAQVPVEYLAFRGTLRVNMPDEFLPTPEPEVVPQSALAV